MLRIYREGGGKGGLGLEVERWEGVVRETGIEPIGLKEMGEAEKKVSPLSKCLFFLLLPGLTLVHISSFSLVRSIPISVVDNLLIICILIHKVSKDLA